MTSAAARHRCHPPLWGGEEDPMGVLTGKTIAILPDFCRAIIAALRE